jgi:hypothetical protein
MANNPLYNKLLERVLSERPDLAPFAELFQQTTDTNENSESEIQTKEIKYKLHKLSSAARFLKEDLDDAMDQLDDLAMALGACEECWGEDKRCPKCRGLGKSGFFVPDDKLFRSLILPALKRIPYIAIKEIN